jgi:hypothetical protein
MKKLIPIVLLALLAALAALNRSTRQPKYQNLATAVWGSRTADDALAR